MQLTSIGTSNWGIGRLLGQQTGLDRTASRIGPTEGHASKLIQFEAEKERGWRAAVAGLQSSPARVDYANWVRAKQRGARILHLQGIWEKETRERNGGAESIEWNNANAGLKRILASLMRAPTRHSPDGSWNWVNGTFGRARNPFGQWGKWSVGE